MSSSDPTPVCAPCPACGSTALVHDRVRPQPHAPDRRVEVFACEECGDWWFEWDGVRLTIDRLTGLDRPR